MKTVELNFKMMLLSGAFLLMSAMLVNGFLSPGQSLGVNSFEVLKAGMTADNPEPENRIIGAPLYTGEQRNEPAQAQLAVVNSQVLGFVPEFDEAWCKQHYPQMKHISLNAEDLVFKDKHGVKITDYDALSLQLAPVVSGNQERVERTHHFEDAYVDVKGVGPLKIKSIRLTFETH